MVFWSDGESNLGVDGVEEWREMSRDVHGMKIKESKKETICVWEDCESKKPLIENFKYFYRNVI